MEIRQLKHFVAVAEEQNFTRAAGRMNIVQSALSTSIRTLEGELGVQLFMRSTRQVRLTTAGRTLYDKARAALGAIDDAHKALSAVQDLQHGRLSIGAVQSLPAFLDLPSLLENFHALHPRIEIHLCQREPTQLLELVTSGQLDLALMPLSGERAGITTRLIACEPLVIACAPAHGFAGRDDLTLRQLMTESFVDFPPEWATRELTDRLFLSAGLARQIAFEIGDLQTLLALVSRGLGIALVPEAIALDHAPTIGIARLADQELCWEVVAAHAATDSGLPDSPAAAAFVEILPSGES